MKIAHRAAIGMIAAGLLVVIPAISASITPAKGAPAQMVVTALPATQKLEAGDVSVVQGKTPLKVIGLERLSGELADMQLFVLLDDSTRSSSLGTQLRDLKAFLQALPPTTEVAVGYMRNGTFMLSQPFTADHGKAAGALRLPASVPGENGSPYFALSDVIKHWPSKETTGRRAVLMLTDGVDRYYSAVIEDDPYVDAAIHSALKDGVMVYTIYLRGAGLYGRTGWVNNMAQSRLLEVSEKTGGYAYFEGLSDPVAIAPFLTNLGDRFANQYRVTIEGANEKGEQPVKVRTELPGVKLSGPTAIYAP